MYQIICIYRHATENPDWAKNVLLLKNTQFLSNHYETWSKYGILTIFRNDWAKIVDSLLKAYFWASPKFYVACLYMIINIMLRQLSVHFARIWTCNRSLELCCYKNDSKIFASRGAPAASDLGKLNFPK